MAKTIFDFNMMIPVTLELRSWDEDVLYCRIISSSFTTRTLFIYRESLKTLWKSGRQLTEESSSFPNIFKRLSSLIATAVLTYISSLKCNIQQVRQRPTECCKRHICRHVWPLLYIWCPRNRHTRLETTLHSHFPRTMPCFYFFSKSVDIIKNESINLKEQIRSKFS